MKFLKDLTRPAAEAAGVYERPFLDGKQVSPGEVTKRPKVLTMEECITLYVRGKQLLVGVGLAGYVLAGGLGYALYSKSIEPQRPPQWVAYDKDGRYLPLQKEYTTVAPDAVKVQFVRDWIVRAFSRPSNESLKVNVDWLRNHTGSQQVIDEWLKYAEENIAPDDVRTLVSEVAVRGMGAPNEFKADWRLGSATMTARVTVGQGTPEWQDENNPTANLTGLKITSALWGVK